MDREWRRRIVGAVVGVALAGSAFVGGVLADRRLLAEGSVLTPAPATSADVADAVGEVANIIEDMALEPTSETSLTAGAIVGMLESLEDSHAAYYDVAHYQYLLEQNSGTFYGIGITITDADNEVVVVSVVEGSPAAAAGIEAEDVIVSIDGVTQDVWSVDEVVLRVRGEEGTSVTLGIRRGEEATLRTFTVTRAAIEVPNIASELLESNVGYIRLYTFNDQSADDVQGAIEDLTAQGAEGFILDLRDNPGGLLSAAVDVSSLFLDSGVIVRVEDRQGAVEEYQATGSTGTELPLVVLINGNSASASEIVAGALQDYARATLVGEQSYGKGSVQQIEQLSFGGAIKLTIAHYVTPKNRVIDKIGLTPDVVVEMDPELAADHATDTQLQRALTELKSSL